MGQLYVYLSTTTTQKAVIVGVNHRKNLKPFLRSLKTIGGVWFWIWFCFLNFVLKLLY